MTPSAATTAKAPIEVSAAMPSLAHLSSAGARELAEKITSKTATIGVVGLGYVGLPLVKAVFRAGFRVIGYDVDAGKVEKLGRGEAYLKHLGEDFCKDLAESDRFSPTSNDQALADADIILLCVPTPLGQHRDPDLSYVLNSTRMVGQTLRRGQLIVLESTTYPGTSRDEMLPLLEKAGATKGLTFGEDYFIAYSPEREDPARPGYTTATIPKLVGGVDADSGRLASAFYRLFIEQVHDVSSAEVAEAAKLLENIYRAVNIAMVNELKVIFDRMGIDIWEVIAAAKTKPFGFQAFYPGPGLGGHCIPIDPFYLTWKAKETGYATKFIELAGEINQHMPRYVISRTMEALNHDGVALRGAKVMVVGLAYKPNVDDVRESPAAEIIKLLHEHGAEVSYHDPHVPEFPPMRRYQYDMKSVPLNTGTLDAMDCVLVITDHDAVDWDTIGKGARLVVDTRNAMARATAPSARIVKA
ncbi:MAG: nucleotide sugar dehydrogenase [Planctomycetota bacterium]